MHSKLYTQKLNLLEKLLVQLTQQEKVLLNGDPDTALEWEDENQKILAKLIQVDKKIETNEESLPFSEMEIQSSSKIFALLKEAREVQSRVQNHLEKYQNEAQTELNQIEIKRQLRSQFNQPEGLHWKKRIC
jgi:hypothetical protein